jgi:hypothetical protein
MLCEICVYCRNINGAQRNIVRSVQGKIEVGNYGESRIYKLRGIRKGVEKGRMPPVFRE